MPELLKRVERIIKWAIFMVFTLMIVAVMVQVYARTFLSQPPLWTEEASRVALLYIVGLGTGASVLTGDLVNVDLALMVMPKAMRKFCELVSAVLVSGFGFFLVPGAWEFTQSGAMQTSPTLETPMQYIFASMLVFSVLLGMFGLVKVVQLVTGAVDSELPAHVH